MKIKLKPFYKFKLEQAVFTLAGRLIKNYDGGSWGYARSFPFWYPHGKSFDVINGANFFEGKLTDKAVGLGLCMMASSLMSFDTSAKGDVIGCEVWCEYYDAIRTYTFDKSKLEKDDMSNLLQFID